ncbi:hypothetical protein BC827DRAFT_1230347, partial [Russula dissimulans]
MMRYHRMMAHLTCTRTRRTNRSGVLFLFFSFSFYFRRREELTCWDLSLRQQTQATTRIDPCSNRSSSLPPGLVLVPISVSGRKHQNEERHDGTGLVLAPSHSHSHSWPGAVLYCVCMYFSTSAIVIARRTAFHFFERIHSFISFFI